MTDTHRLTNPTDFSQSLTGYDEMAIRKAFGEDITKLRGNTFGRALLFIANRRDGQKDAEAKNAALSLTVREVVESFAPDPDAAGPEADPDAEGE